jgi:hypothetical protein
MTPLGQRLLDCFSHLQLPAAKLVRRMGSRKHAAGAKELVQRWQAGGGGCGLGGGGHDVKIVFL